MSIDFSECTSTIKCVTDTKKNDSVVYYKLLTLNWDKSTETLNNILTKEITIEWS